MAKMKPVKRWDISGTPKYWAEEAVNELYYTGAFSKAWKRIFYKLWRTLECDIRRLIWDQLRRPR